MAIYPIPHPNVNAIDEFSCMESGVDSVSSWEQDRFCFEDVWTKVRSTVLFLSLPDSKFLTVSVSFYWKNHNSGVGFFGLGSDVFVKVFPIDYC